MQVEVNIQRSLNNIKQLGYDWRGFWTQVVEKHEYKKTSALFVNHKELQINILSKKVASDKLSLEVDFC